MIPELSPVAARFLLNANHARAMQAMRSTAPPTAIPAIAPVLNVTEPLEGEGAAEVEEESVGTVVVTDVIDDIEMEIVDAIDVTDDFDGVDAVEMTDDADDADDVSAVIFAAVKVASSCFSLTQENHLKVGELDAIQVCQWQYGMVLSQV